MASGEDPHSKVTTGMTRKLAAILSADVAGYGRLMGEDEEATIRTITAYRDVIATLVQQHRGRVVDSPGDNLLAEFPSVVDAVQCAVAIQRELHARNTALPPQRRMQFRLGINLGDVITEGEQIYGDGVNIAARLESLAEAGGICISGTVYDQIATRLPLGYKFLGERVVKNITRPVRVYRIQTESGSPGLKVRLRNRLGGGPWPKVAFGLLALLLILGVGVASWRLFVHSSLPITVVPPQKTTAVGLADKPSIAVLPFVNMSGEPAQEYFSDGMTEDLITDLARLRGLFVIARNSVFTYKGKAVKVDQVGQELGVKYILEGSVRKADDRIRITAQLVEAATGYHLWAERYDRGLQDIFAVQEEIARKITASLAVRLTAEEKATMERQYTNNVEAWELWSRGAELYRKYTKEDNAKARELFEQAISLDPQFARAYANLAATHRQDWNARWSQDPQASERQAFELAERSVALDPSLPYGHHQLAYLYLYREDHDRAIAEAERAVKLDPNDADSYAALAVIQAYAGRPQEAIPLMEQAIRLNPKVPVYYFFHLGLAYYVMKHYDKAEQNLQEALRINPNYRPARGYLVAVYSETGRKTEANRQAALTTATKLLKSGNRQLAEEHIRRITPYKDLTIRDRLRAAWQETAN
ncbi:MAG TPA: tetratricopeptide repeat protein [Candidatus Tectomicrobia bacterium]|nr:tetratricopeptide repeat protein [Candidatus Tectomicrobia bacterium]